MAWKFAKEGAEFWLEKLEELKSVLYPVEKISPYSKRVQRVYASYYMLNCFKIGILLFLS